MAFDGKINEAVEIHKSNRVVSWAITAYPVIMANYALPKAFMNPSSRPEQTQIYKSDPSSNIIASLV